MSCPHGVCLPYMSCPSSVGLLRKTPYSLFSSVDKAQRKLFLHVSLGESNTKFSLGTLLSFATRHKFEAIQVCLYVAYSMLFLEFGMID